MKDDFTKDWIIENSIQVVSEYEKGILTLRALHYQLVGLGMTNDIQHYKRVVSAMIDARWNDQISFDTFSDLDRGMVGETPYKETILEKEIDNGQHQIEAWMRSYHKNRWENQPIYPEIFIEKKALQGVFQEVCSDWDIALGACKGYPSLTFLYESYKRFCDAADEGKRPLIIYFGDYDPSGEDIPRSIKENLSRFGVEVEVQRIALMEDQVVAWKLPPAPAKVKDSRTANWDGLGQVELDAVKPEKLMRLLKDAINEIFDPDLYDELMDQENDERVLYQKALKKFVKNMK
ncbi:MAG: hypothetical protein LLG40_05190 [Deltaproteobacteria bacterium]|nr:hypothetical protein [Deltaproteobacteria bacterium]